MAGNFYRFLRETYGANFKFRSSFQNKWREELRWRETEPYTRAWHPPAGKHHDADDDEVSTIIMRSQSFAFILYAHHHFFAARAWPTTTARIGATRSSSVTLFGGGLLANTIRCGHNHNRRSPICFVKADDDEGECGATANTNLDAFDSSYSNGAHDTMLTVNSSSASSLSRKPKSGDVVTFTLQRFQPIKDGNDETILPLEPLFDTIGTQQIVLNGGHYLPSLHDLLSRMNPGEFLQGATIDAGYGEYNPQLVFQLPASSIGDSIDTSLVKIGTVLQMGNGMECRVINLNDDGWTLDANHVMAGAAYEVDVKLEAVEEGPTHWEYVEEEEKSAGKSENKYKVATFALGCFWGGGE